MVNIFNMRNSKLFSFILGAIFLSSSKLSVADNKKPLKIEDDSPNNYLSYLEVGATRFFNVKSKDSAATSLDFFVPLWQTPANLVFTDVRFYDRTGRPFEGNFHLGYRHLEEERQHIYGIYGAFDRKRTGNASYFNQLMFGAECWFNKIFIGGSYYQPIGSSINYISKVESTEYFKVSQNIGNVWVLYDQEHERSMRGVDGEVGYEILPGLAGYVGGYYFSAKDVESIYGPKAKLSYDWSLKNGKKILNIFDKIGLEAGVQYDKPRGTTWYLNAKLRIGLLSNRNSNLQGVARHMVDLVRRDVDIVTNKRTIQERYLHEKIAEVYSDEELNNVPPEVRKILIRYELKDEKILQEFLDNSPDKKEFIFGDRTSVVSHRTGRTLAVDLGSSQDLDLSRGQRAATEESQKAKEEKNSNQFADKPTEEVNTTSAQSPEPTNYGIQDFISGTYDLVGDAASKGWSGAKRVVNSGYETVTTGVQTLGTQVTNAGYATVGGAYGAAANLATSGWNNVKSSYVAAAGAGVAVSGAAATVAYKVWSKFHPSITPPVNGLRGEGQPAVADGGGASPNGRPDTGGKRTPSPSIRAIIGTGSLGTTVAPAAPVVPPPPPVDSLQIVKVENEFNATTTSGDKELLEQAIKMSLAGTAAAPSPVKLQQQQNSTVPQSTVEEMTLLEKVNQVSSNVVRPEYQGAVHDMLIALPASVINGVYDAFFKNEDGSNSAPQAPTRSKKDIEGIIERVVKKLIPPIYNEAPQADIREREEVRASQAAASPVEPQPIRMPVVRGKVSLGKATDYIVSRVESKDAETVKGMLEQERDTNISRIYNALLEKSGVISLDDILKIKAQRSHTPTPEGRSRVREDISSPARRRAQSTPPSPVELTRAVVKKETEEKVDMQMSLGNITAAQAAEDAKRVEEARQAAEAEQSRIKVEQEAEQLRLAEEARKKAAEEAEKFNREEEVKKVEAEQQAAERARLEAEEARRKADEEQRVTQERAKQEAKAAEESRRAEEKPEEIVAAAAAVPEPKEGKQAEGQVDVEQQVQQPSRGEDVDTQAILSQSYIDLSKIIENANENQVDAGYTNEQKRAILDLDEAAMNLDRYDSDHPLAERDSIVVARLVHEMQDKLRELREAFPNIGRGEVTTADGRMVDLRALSIFGHTELEQAMQGTNSGEVLSSVKQPSVVPINGSSITDSVLSERKQRLRPTTLSEKGVNKNLEKGNLGISAADVSKKLKELKRVVFSKEVVNKELEQGARGVSVADLVKRRQALKRVGSDKVLQAAEAPAVAAAESEQKTEASQAGIMAPQEGQADVEQPVQQPSRGEEVDTQAILSQSFMVLSKIVENVNENQVAAEHTEEQKRAISNLLEAGEKLDEYESTPGDQRKTYKWTKLVKNMQERLEEVRRALPNVGRGEVATPDGRKMDLLAMSAWGHEARRQANQSANSREGLAEQHRAGPPSGFDVTVDTLSQVRQGLRQTPPSSKKVDVKESSIDRRGVTVAALVEKMRQLKQGVSKQVAEAPAAAAAGEAIRQDKGGAT